MAVGSRCFEQRAAVDGHRVEPILTGEKAKRYADKIGVGRIKYIARIAVAIDRQQLAGVGTLAVLRIIIGIVKGHAVGRLEPDLYHHALAVEVVGVVDRRVRQNTECIGRDIDEAVALFNLAG